MAFEQHGEAVIAACEQDELKLVYRILHAQLSEHAELMETDFLIELQNFLHAQAKAEGVDTSDHGAWDAWLGHDNPTPCPVRMRSCNPQADSADR